MCLADEQDDDEYNTIDDNTIVNELEDYDEQVGDGIVEVNGVGLDSTIVDVKVKIRIDSTLNKCSSLFLTPSTKASRLDLLTDE